MCVCVCVCVLVMVAIAVADLGGAGVATPPPHKFCLSAFFFSDYKLFCYFPETVSSYTYFSGSIASIVR